MTKTDSSCSIIIAFRGNTYFHNVCYFRNTSVIVPDFVLAQSLRKAIAEPPLLHTHKRYISIIIIFRIEKVVEIIPV